jgi:hypothetical protein
MIIFDGTSLNNIITILPQDTQNDGRPTKLSLENSGGPECPNSSTTMSMVVLSAKPPKYTLEYAFPYSQTKYPSAFGNP